jgi:hypothetical protein
MAYQITGIDRDLVWVAEMAKEEKSGKQMSFELFYELGKEIVGKVMWGE